VYGHEGSRNAHINKLGEIFAQVKSNYDLSEGDFPKLEDMKVQLRTLDFKDFPKLDIKVLDSLQEMLRVDIPRITAHVAGVSPRGGPTHIHAENELNSVPVFRETIDSTERSPFLFAIISALLVALIAVYVASHFDNHEKATVILEQAKEFVAKLMTKSS